MIARPAVLVLPGALAGVAGGIFLADAGAGLPDLVALLTAGCLVAALVAAALRARPALLAVPVAAITVGAVVGAWRAPTAQPPTGPGTVAASVGDTEWVLAGTLTDDPRLRPENAQAVLDRIALAAPDTSAGGPRPARTVAGKLLAWLPRSVELKAGDRIRFTARLDEPQDFDGFAYRAYLARQGISAVARVYELEVVGREPNPVATVALGLRAVLLDGLQRTVPEPAAALAAGILLGVRSGIDQEIEDSFTTSGLTHVVAISGWNIAIVAAAVGSLSTPLRRRPGGRWISPVVMSAAIGFYVLLTGAGPSVVRAALMAGAMLVARVGGSRSHAASALMLAALIMLVAAPAVLWDVGFQLSLLATAGLIIAAEPIAARLAGWPAILREPISLTLAAQITTLPVILFNFDRLSLIAPLANVIVVPLVPLVMLAAALAAVVGALHAAVTLPVVGDALVWLVGGAAWLYVSAMIAAAGVTSAFPYAAVDVSVPAWLAIAYYPALAIGWLVARRARAKHEQRPVTDDLEPIATSTGRSGRSRAQTVTAAAGVVARRLVRPLPLSCATLLVLTAFALARAPDGRLHLITLDVGQGDAILVESPSGKTILVDGGPHPDLTLRRLAEELPLQAWTLDVVILSHPHEDHVAGLVEVLRRYEVGTVLEAGHPYDSATYPRFLAEVAADGAQLVLARTGQRVDIGDGVTFEVLYPSAVDAAAPLPEGDINNASVVGVLRFGGFSALLTGDAELPVERLLIGRDALQPVTMLKVGHHGSHSSTSPALLAAVRPMIATISTGTGNAYGHPAPETLQALADAPGVTVYRTDQHGTVDVVSDGRNMSVETDRGVGRASAVLSHHAAAAVTIAAWPSLLSPPPASCSSTSVCPKASWSTAKVSRASPRRPLVWSPPPASRWMWPSSRSPPCSTTSTSCRRGEAAAGTERSGRHT